MTVDAVLVLTTEGSAALAEALANHLIEQRLAACVALQPLQSLYRWQGQIEQSQEVQLLIKTHPACLDALERAVRSQHSYTTPQWLHWPVQASRDYAAWLAACCALS